MATPRYLNTTSLAHRLGVPATTVANWRRRYPFDGQLLPTPTPDGWEITARGDVPLWFEHQVPAWQTWKQAHTRLVADWFAARPSLRAKAKS